MTDASERAQGDPRGRIPFYYPLLVAGLVLLLAVAGMAYAWTMRNLFPAMELVRIPTAQERGEPPLRQGPKRRLRLIQPASNIACAEEQGFDLWSQVERWRALSTALGFATEVGGIGRVPGTSQGIDAIVVPWVLCLSDEERQIIDGYARAGGGVILAGAAGLSGEAPEPFSEDALFVVPAGRTAAGSALDPGRRLEIPRGSPAYSHASEHPMLWWSGWHLRPTPGLSDRWQAAAAVRGGVSRQAWFGFPVSHGAPGSEAELDRLRSLALQWVAGDDVVAVAPWPDARDFAWVVSLDVHGDDPEMEAALEASEALDLRSTVFVYSDVADGRPRLRAALRASAELGSRGDRRTRFEGGTRIHQRQKLASSRAALGRIHGREVRGLRIPRERLDALTMHEASEAGYRYVVGDPDFDRAYPRWVSAEGSPMALVSRAASADDSAGRERVTPGELIGDLQRMRSLGGLWVLTLSGPGLADPVRRAALAPVMERAEATRPWKATASEAVEWVRQRARLEFELSSSGRLRIANPGATPLESVVIEVFGDGLEPTRRAVPRLAGRGAAALQLGDDGVALAPGRPLPLLAADGRRLAEDAPRRPTPSFAHR